MSESRKESQSMTELMLLLADLMPLEKLMDMMYEKLLVYRADKTDESLQAVEGICMLMLTKRTIAKDPDPNKGVEKFKTFLSEVREGHEFISRLKGTNSDLYNNNKDQGEGEE